VNLGQLLYLQYVIKNNWLDVADHQQPYNYNTEMFLKRRYADNDRKPPRAISNILKLVISSGDVIVVEMLGVMNVIFFTLFCIRSK